MFVVVRQCLTVIRGVWRRLLAAHSSQLLLAFLLSRTIEQLRNGSSKKVVLLNCGPWQSMAMLASRDIYNTDSQTIGRT